MNSSLASAVLKPPKILNMNLKINESSSPNNVTARLTEAIAACTINSSFNSMKQLHIKPKPPKST
jgi:hypothetical protein